MKLDDFSTQLLTMFADKILECYNCHLELGRGSRLQLRDEQFKLMGKSIYTFEKSMVRWFRSWCTKEDILKYIGYTINEIYPHFELWDETMVEILAMEREKAIAAQSPFALELLALIDAKYPTLDWHPAVSYFRDNIVTIHDKPNELHYKLIQGNNSFTALDWHQSKAEWDAHFFRSKNPNICSKISPLTGSGQKGVPAGLSNYWTLIDNICATSERQLVNMRCKKELPAAKQWKRFIKNYQTSTIK